MKKVISIFVLILSVSLLVDLQAKRSSGNNILALSTGLITGREDGIYSGFPINDWTERATSFYGSAKYLGRVYPTFLVGPYFEYEHIGYQSGVTISGTKLGFGLEFVSRIPALIKNLVGFELGGIIGLGIFDMGIIGIDSLTGVDYGVFAGPVFKLSDEAHLAFHFGSCQGWYFATIPEAVGIPSTRLVFVYSYIYHYNSY